MFNLFRKIAESSTSQEYLFNATFNEIKKASKQAQIQAAVNILYDLQVLTEERGKIDTNLVPALHEHYKKMRQEAIQNGASSDRDPDYAYPALLETMFFTMTKDPGLANQMSKSIGLWCQELGLDKK